MVYGTGKLSPLRRLAQVSHLSDGDEYIADIKTSFVGLRAHRHTVHQSSARKREAERSTPPLFWLLTVREHEDEANDPALVSIGTIAFAAAGSDSPDSHLCMPSFLLRPCLRMLVIVVSSIGECEYLCWCEI